MDDAVLQELDRRIGAVIQQGRAETPDFDAQSAFVVALGASERPEFTRAIATLPNAHRAVSALADDPERAMAVLAMPGPQMTVELAKLAAKERKPAAPAEAAAPATSDMASRDYIEMRNRRDRERRQEPALPKRVPIADADLRKLSGREFIEARQKSAPLHLGGRWR